MIAEVGINWDSLTYTAGSLLKAVIGVNNASGLPSSGLAWTLYRNNVQIATGTTPKVEYHATNPGLYRIVATAKVMGQDAVTGTSAVQVAGGFEVQGTPIPTAVQPSCVYLGGLYTAELTGAGGYCSSVPFQLASFTESIPLLPGTTHVSFDLDPLQNTVDDEAVVRTALGNWLLRGYPTGLHTEDVGYDYRGDQPLLPAPVDNVLRLTVDAWKVKGRAQYSPQLGYNAFSQWLLDTFSADDKADLIGRGNLGDEINDVLPGNGRYLRVRNYADADQDIYVRTSQPFSLTEGLKYRLSLEVAGSQVPGGDDVEASVDMSSMPGDLDLPRAWSDGFTTFSNTFDALSSTTEGSIEMQFRQQVTEGNPYSPIIGKVKLTRVDPDTLQDIETIFYEDWDNENRNASLRQDAIAEAFSFRVRVKCWRQTVPIYQYIRCPYSTHPGGAGQRARKFAALFTEMDIETDVDAGLERMGAGVNTYKTTNVESVPLQTLTASGAPHRARTPTGAFFTDSNWFAIYESAADVDLPELDVKAVSALEGVRPFYMTLTEPGLPPIVQRVKRLGGKMVLYMAQGALTAGTIVRATVHTSRLHSSQQQVTYSLTVTEDIYNASTDTFQKIGEIEISLEDYQFSGPGVVVDFTVVESGATPTAFPCGKPDAVWGLETILTPSKAHSVSHDGACYQRPTLQPLVDTEASAVVVPNDGCHDSACGPVGVYCYQNLNGSASVQFPQPLHFPSPYVARVNDPLNCYGSPLFVAERDEDGDSPTVAASNNLANVAMKRPAPTTKYGAAAIGNVGDFWNTYEFPVLPGTTAGFGYLTPIYFGNGGNANALLAQSVAGPGAIEDATLTMFRGIESTGHGDAMMAFAGSIPTNLYGGENAFIITVPAGTYDVYVYMHGGADNRNGRAHVRTTGHDYGIKSTGTTAAWLGSFVEGAQYVKFSDVIADSHLEIVMLSGATGTACYLNGLQLKYKDIADAPTQVANPAVFSVASGSLVSYPDNSLCGDGYLYRQCDDTSQNAVIVYPHATSPHAVVEHDNVCWSRASGTINGSVARRYIDILSYALISVADVTVVPDCLDTVCTGTNASGYSVVYVDTQTGMKQPVSFPYLDLGVPVVAACPQVEDSGITLQPGSLTVHFTKPRVHLFTSPVATSVEVDVGLQGRTKKLVIVRGSSENALTLGPDTTMRSLSLLAGDDVYLDIGNAVGRLTTANRVRTVVTWKQVVILPRLYHTATVSSLSATAIRALGFTGLTDKQSYTLFDALPVDTAQAFPNPDNIVTVQGTSGPEYVLVRSRAIGDPVAQLPGGLDWYAGQEISGNLTFRFYTSREERGAHGEMDVWLDAPGSFPVYVTVDPYRELVLDNGNIDIVLVVDFSQRSTTYLPAIKEGFPSIQARLVASGVSVRYGLIRFTDGNALSPNITTYSAILPSINALTNDANEVEFGSNALAKAATANFRAGSTRYAILFTDEGDDNSPPSEWSPGNYSARDAAITALQAKGVRVLAVRNPTGVDLTGASTELPTLTYDYIAGQTGGSLYTIQDLVANPTGFMDALGGFLVGLANVKRRTTMLGDISRNSVRAATSATASNYPIVYAALDGQVIAVTKRVNTIVYNNKLFFPTTRFDPGISSRLITPAQEGSVRLFQGVTYIRRAPFIHIVEIDLTAPGISFQLSGQAGSIDAVTQRTDDFLTAVNAQLAVNTNFFLPAGGTDVNVVGFAASMGNIVSLFEPQPIDTGYQNQNYAIVEYAPALNIDQDNVPSIVHRDPSDNGVLEGVGEVQIWNAVSGSAQIITNGVITIPTYGVELTAMSGYSNSFSWYDQNFARCAMGFDVTGKRLYWLCADGAATVGGEGGISVRRIAQILQELGCHNAINLDGGSSVGLAYRKDGVTTVLNDPNNGGTQRRVALSLALFANPL